MWVGRALGAIMIELIGPSLIFISLQWMPDVRTPLGVAIYVLYSRYNRRNRCFTDIYPAILRGW